MADEQEVPSWTEISSKLDPMLPQEDYDKMRQHYYYTQVAPKIHPSKVMDYWHEFKARTERPPLQSTAERWVARAEIAGKSAVRSLIAPLSLIPAVKEKVQSMDQDLASMAQVAAREGYSSTLPQLAGELAGMAIPFGAAFKGARVLTNPLVARAFANAKSLETAQRIVSGTLAMGAYNAAAEVHGNRLRAGIEGAAWGAAGELIATPVLNALKDRKKVAGALLGTDKTPTSQTEIADAFAKIAASKEVAKEGAKLPLDVRVNTQIPGISLVMKSKRPTEAPVVIDPLVELDWPKRYKAYIENGWELEGVTYQPEYEAKTREILASFGNKYEAKIHDGYTLKVEKGRAEEIAAKMTAEGTPTVAVGDSAIKAKVSGPHTQLAFGLTRKLAPTASEDVVERHEIAMALAKLKTGTDSEKLDAMWELAYHKDNMYPQLARVVDKHPELVAKLDQLKEEKLRVGQHVEEVEKEKEAIRATPLEEREKLTFVPQAPYTKEQLIEKGMTEEQASRAVAKMEKGVEEEVGKKTKEFERVENVIGSKQVYELLAKFPRMSRATSAPKIEPGKEGFERAFLAEEIKRGWDPQLVRSAPGRAQLARETVEAFADRYVGLREALPTKTHEVIAQIYFGETQATGMTKKLAIQEGLSILKIPKSESMDPLPHTAPLTTPTVTAALGGQEAVEAVKIRTGPRAEAKPRVSLSLSEQAYASLFPGGGRGTTTSSLESLFQRFEAGTSEPVSEAMLKKPTTITVEGASRQELTHEWLHADLRNNPEAWGTVIHQTSDALTSEHLANQFAKLEVYKKKSWDILREEAFVHAADAIRMNDKEKLALLGKIDISVARVKEFVSGTSAIALASLKDTPDLAARRVLERKLRDLVLRAGAPSVYGIEAAAARVGARAYYNAEQRLWKLVTSEGKISSFNNHTDLLDYIYHVNGAEIALPSFTSRLEDLGLHTFAFTSKFEEKNFIDTRLRPLPEVGITSEQLSTGWLALTAWTRPFKPWVNSMHVKVNSVFKARGEYLPIAETVDKLDVASSEGFSWLEKSCYKPLSDILKPVGAKRLHDYFEVLADPAGRKNWSRWQQTLELADDDITRIGKIEDWMREFRVDSSIVGRATPEIIKERAAPPTAFARKQVTAVEKSKGLFPEQARIKETVTVEGKPRMIPGDVTVPPTSTAKPGINMLEYLREMYPKLKQANFASEIIFPNSYNAREATLWEKALKDSSLMFEPSDTNLGRFLHWGVRQAYEQKFVAEPLKELEKLIERKGADGRYVLPGALRRPLERYSKYMRGLPDPSQLLLNSWVKGVQNGLTTTFKHVNNFLPEGAKLPTEFSSPQTALNKFMLLSYMAGLGLRPAIVLRDSAQVMMTTLPVLGVFDFAKGLTHALTSKGYQLAKDSGALLGRANIGELYGDIVKELPFGKAGQGAWVDLANKLLAPSRWGNNFARNLTFHGEYWRAARAIEQFRLGKIDQEALVKSTALWFNDAPVIDRLVKMSLPGSGVEVKEVAKKFALELIDLTQWPYRRGTQPAVLTTGMGRIFGQYGQWPMNYVDFMARLTTRSVQYPNKALQMAGYWIASNKAMSALGEEAGADLSKWFWTSPAGYAGSPQMDFVQNLMKMADETDEGRQARKEVLSYPLNFIPASVEMQAIIKAMDEMGDSFFTGDGFRIDKGALRALGFRPINEVEQYQDWQEWLAYETGFKKTRYK